MDISFIIVNYQSKQYLEKCLQSLKENIPDLTWEVVIVNNDQEELTFSSVIKNVKIINSGTNSGFSRACNLGAKNAIGEILFFLNPDTELLSTNVSEIKNFFSLNENVGIISPRLIIPNGSAQKWSAGFEITLLDIIKNNIGLISSKSLWNTSTQTQVGWVSGAAMAIKKSFFEKVSGFDENFFMYFEDADLCKRISQEEKEIFILPSIRILHHGGQSISSTKKQKSDYYASQDYYFEKHFGKFQLFILRTLRYFH